MLNAVCAYFCVLPLTLWFRQRLRLCLVSLSFFWLFICEWLAQKKELSNHLDVSRAMHASHQRRRRNHLYAFSSLYYYIHTHVCECAVHLHSINTNSLNHRCQFDSGCPHAKLCVHHHLNDEKTTNRRYKRNQHTCTRWAASHISRTIFRFYPNTKLPLDVNRKYQVVKNKNETFTYIIWKVSFVVLSSWSLNSCFFQRKIKSSNGN